jgi:hypothetical protein
MVNNYLYYSYARQMKFDKASKKSFILKANSFKLKVLKRIRVVFGINKKTYVFKILSIDHNLIYL